MDKLSTLQEKLLPQITREYQEGYNHISTWRSDVQSEVRNIEKRPPEGEVFIDLVKENCDFERATFLTDDIDVTFVSEDGVLGDRTMKALKNVQQFDYTEQGRREMKDRIIIDNVYYGIAVEVVDMYDEDEQQPMSALINPDVCVPDPKCTNNSEMRFFGFSRKVARWIVENNDAYDLQGRIIESQDMNLINSNNARNADYTIASNEGLIDLYEHYTIYDGKKWLTTWVNDRSLLIRAVELTELTRAEKLNAMKCKYPIVFHRRRPHPYRWSGYRVSEEVGNSEDIVTQLKNLEIAQARIATHGPDTMYTSALGIDAGKMQKAKVGGRMIEVNPVDSIGNHIFQKNYQGNNTMATSVSQYLLDRVQRNTGYTDITMGVSPDGQQTKAEIQQLQANANKFIAWVSSCYLHGEKEYYYLWYRSYQENMPKNGKKIIALFDKGGMSRTLKKDDFITNGKILIDVKSASQERIINEKSVTKLIALAPNILPNLTSKQSVNTFLRTMIDKSGVGVSGTDMIPLSYDELTAMSRLERLNANIPVISRPMPGEDLKTHIDIYEKGLDTEARNELLAIYKEAYRNYLQESVGTADLSSGNQAMNTLSQQTA